MADSDGDGEPRRYSRQPSDLDLRGSRRRKMSISTLREEAMDENTRLLGGHGDGTLTRRGYSTMPGTPRPRISRGVTNTSGGGGEIRSSMPSRTPSFAQRLSWALTPFDNDQKYDYLDDRVWYDQFTSIGILPIDCILLC